MTRQQTYETMRQQLYEFLLTQLSPDQFCAISTAYNNDFTIEGVAWDLGVPIEVIRMVYVMRDIDFKNHDENNRWFSQWRTEYKAQNGG